MNWIVQYVTTQNFTNGFVVSVKKPKAQKLSFKEKREFETLETAIAAHENRLAEIEKELIQFATDAYKLSQLFDEQQKLNSRLETDSMRWLELSERAE